MSNIFKFILFVFVVNLISYSSARVVHEWDDEMVAKHQDHRHFRHHRQHVKKRIKDASSNPSISQTEEGRDRTSISRLSNSISLASQHYLDIQKNFSCSKPRPTLIYVSQEEYTPGKTFLPRCTLLFRCDRESGCCDNEGFECGPKKQEAVPKYFYVLRPNMSTTVEMKMFVNHTECECREINPHPRTVGISIPNLEGSAFISRLTPVASPPDIHDKVTPDDYMTSTHATPNLPNLTSDDITSNNVGDKQDDKGKEDLCAHITCPKNFRTKRLTDHPPHKCICDCDNNNVLCIRVKKGLNRLDANSTRCVRKGSCLQPSCEYGEYFDTIKGICPLRKANMDDSFPMKPKHPHYAHERD